MTLPTIVASENGRRGMLEAMALLRRGGAALDAVEVAARVTEDDPADHSVGHSGLPNVLGEVELDASIMDGRTLRAGAVAAVQGYAHPITLARRVMERLPHVLLVGRGAERFAAEIGCAPQEQLTEEALARWRERFGRYGLEPGATPDLIEAARLLTRPVDLDRFLYRDAVLPELTREQTQGTVNFLALDAHGDMASAVSTSGIAWKYPGRAGDSPLIGAGNYCDNRHGAAACTGLGELAIRAGTARSLLLYLKMGLSLAEAGGEALRDLLALRDPSTHSMNIVALTPGGAHAGFSTAAGKRYLYMTAEMDAPAVAERQTLADDAAAG